MGRRGGFFPENMVHQTMNTNKNKAASASNINIHMSCILKASFSHVV